MAFSGGAGDDILDASASTMVGFPAISLDGGTGNDVLIGCPSSNNFRLSGLNIGDHVYGGVSFDWLTVFSNGGSDEALSIIGQQGTLYANGSSDVVFDGIDVFQWSIHPEDSDDHLVDASASTLDYLYFYGGGGDDTSSRANMRPKKASCITSISKAAGALIL